MCLSRPPVFVGSTLLLPCGWSWWAWRRVMSANARPRGWSSRIRVPEQMNRLRSVHAYPGERISLHRHFPAARPCSCLYQHGCRGCSPPSLLCDSVSLRSAVGSICCRSPRMPLWRRMTGLGVHPSQRTAGPGYRETQLTIATGDDVPDPKVDI
jgi:hypothetical protein